MIPSMATSNVQYHLLVCSKRVVRVCIIYWQYNWIIGAPELGGENLLGITDISVRLHGSRCIIMILSPMSILPCTHSSSNAPQAKRFTTIILWKKWKLSEIYDVVEPREPAPGGTFCWFYFSNGNYSATTRGILDLSSSKESPWRDLFNSNGFSVEFFQKWFQKHS